MHATWQRTDDLSLGFFGWHNHKLDSGEAKSIAFIQHLKRELRLAWKQRDVTAVIPLRIWRAGGTKHIRASIPRHTKLSCRVVGITDMLPELSDRTFNHRISILVGLNLCNWWRIFTVRPLSESQAIRPHQHPQHPHRWTPSQKGSMRSAAQAQHRVPRIPLFPS